MTIALAFCCAMALQEPQEPQVLFVVRNAPAAEGEAARTFVAADSRRVDCLQALGSLCAAVGWNLVVESKPLENDLPPLCPFDLRDREPARSRRRTPSVGPPRGGPLSRAHQVLPLFCLSVSGRVAPSAGRFRPLFGQTLRWVRGFYPLPHGSGRGVGVGVGARS